MSTAMPEHPLVWCEIPVTDLKKSKVFYAEVLANPLEDMEIGPDVIAVFPSQDGKTAVAGHLYEGEPAQNGGPTVHLAVTDRLENALDRVSASGGEVVSDIIEIPAGRFAYCKDIDGNSIGLFSGAM